MEKSERPTLSGLKTAELRTIAEETLRKLPADSEVFRDVSVEDAQKLVHELRIHRIELQMQNEELARSRLELETSRSALAELYNLAPVGYFTVDSRGRITEANPAAAAILGAERSKLAGQLFGRYVAAESEQEYHTFRKGVQGAGQPLSAILLMIKTDGSNFFAQIEGVAAAGGKTGQCYFSVTDTTLLVRAQQALQRSEQIYHTLIANIPAVTWTRDGQGTITFVSPNVEAVLGYCGQELLGTDLRFWRRQVHPDDAPVLIQNFMKVLSEGITPDVHYRFRHKGGQWIWLQSRVVGRSEDGGTIRIDGILTDITERRRAEEQTAEFQRRHTSLERQAALGQVAAAVAHEISNPLGGIQNAFLLMKKAIPENHPNARFVSLADKELRRMSEIVRQMTMFYRPQSARRCDCDVVAAIKETVEFLAADSRACEISIRVLNELPELCARMNEGELRQVIYNIVINALQASKQGGVVDIRTERAGDNVRIVVTDHGKGIEENILSHIFEPFYSGSKRSESNGMGIGLSVSRNLVAAAGGSIHVKTTPGAGSTFSISLPCAKSVDRA